MGNDEKCFLITTSEPFTMPDEFRKFFFSIMVDHTIPGYNVEVKKFVYDIRVNKEENASEFVCVAVAFNYGDSAIAGTTSFLLKHVPKEMRLYEVGLSYVICKPGLSESYTKYVVDKISRK